MNAAEARERTNKHLHGTCIEDQFQSVMEAVEDAVTNGKFFIMNPFGTCFRAPSVEEERALRQRLSSLGYVITDHPDPDPGHYASRAYTTLSWE